MIKSRLIYLLLFVTINIATITASFVPSIANADVHVGLGASFLKVDTDPGSTSPITAGLSLGYSIDAHMVELVLMTGVDDDNLNQLVTDIPAAGSLLYRFTVNPRDSFKINLVLGYSQIEVESTYVNVPTFSETFSGVSWGVGLEESLDSIPELSIRADFIQMYRGDDLTINSINVGVRYDF